MEIRESMCKSALSPSRLPGLAYSLNPYKGCQHNCAYCYVPNVLRINRGDWGRFVEVKKNIPHVLSKELPKKKPGVIGLSTVTDPYQPIEKRFTLTRFCLQQIQKYTFPISIQTKSDLISRDIDILSRMSDVEVIMSIATIDDSLRRLLEPFSSSISNRLSAMKTCSDAGLNVSVFFGPIYPTISSNDIPEILALFQDHGATSVYIDKFNMKPGIWESVTASLPQEIQQIFSDNIYDDGQYYRCLRECILTDAKKKGINLIDAF